MEIILRETQKYPAQVPVPLRPLLTTSPDAKKQMARDRSTKAAIDALEERVKKHDEKNILRTEKQRFDAAMCLQNYRDSRGAAGLYNRLTNLDLARSALQLPASLAGMNLIRGMHVPAAPPVAPPAPFQENEPEYFDVADSEPEGAATSSLAMSPGKTEKKRETREKR